MMDPEPDAIELEMIRQQSLIQQNGSILCLSKQAIKNTFDDLLSRISFIAVIYIANLIYNLISSKQPEEETINIVGYISFIIALSYPIGLYASSRQKNWAQVTYYILTCIHLYVLLMYIWLSHRNNSKLSHLHLILTSLYTLVVFLSLIFTCLRLISQSKSTDPPRIVVIDNNPLE